MLLLLVLTAGCATPKVWYSPNHTADEADTEEAMGRLAFYNLGRQYEPGLEGMVKEQNDEGHFVKGWMVAHGYKETPKTAATNSPALAR